MKKAPKKAKVKESVKSPMPVKKPKLAKMAQKLKRGKVLGKSKSKAPESFGFNKPKAKAKTPNAKARNAPAAKKKKKKAAPKGKSKVVQKKKKPALSHETFGFGQKPATLGDAVDAKTRAQAEEQAKQQADDLHIWVANKPVNSMALMKKIKLKAKLRKNALHERSEKKRLSKLTPAKELTNKHQARLVADSLHVWVDGVPHVAKKKTHLLKAVTAKPDRKLGENAGVEDMNTMQATMKLSASSRVDSSKAMKLQNKIPHRTEYTFTVHNTDAKEQSVGVARNMHVHMDLPKNAQVEDGYFYLEGKTKADKMSHSCKITNGDQNTNAHVNCFLPYVKSLVDIHIRANYRGDQNALRTLSDQFVHAELHTKGQVVTRTRTHALKTQGLLQRMPNDM